MNSAALAHDRARRSRPGSPSGGASCSARSSARPGDDRVVGRRAPRARRGRSTSGRRPRGSRGGRRRSSRTPGCAARRRAGSRRPGRRSRRGSRRGRGTRWSRRAATGSRSAAGRRPRRTRASRSGEQRAGREQHRDVGEARRAHPLVARRRRAASAPGSPGCGLHPPAVVADPRRERGELVGLAARGGRRASTCPSATGPPRRATGTGTVGVGGPERVQRRVARPGARSPSSCMSCAERGVDPVDDPGRGTGSSR